MTTPRRQRQPQSQPEGSPAAGYESELWRMADALRGSMDAAEYKHVVLGLIFLKYISDAFEEAYATLESERDQGADPGGPRRVPGPEHLLGASRGPVAASPESSASAQHRPLGGRRDDRGGAG